LKLVHTGTADVVLKRPAFSHFGSARRKERRGHYGKERAKTDGSEIRILNEAGEAIETLRFKDGEYESVTDTRIG